MTEKQDNAPRMPAFQQMPMHLRPDLQHLAKGTFGLRIVDGTLQQLWEIETHDPCGLVIGKTLEWRPVPIHSTKQPTHEEAPGAQAN